MEKIENTNENIAIYIKIINQYSSVVVNETNLKDMDLIDNCEFDSYQMIEFVCMLEEAFGIEFDDEMLLAEKLRKVGELWRILTKG